MLQAGRMVLSYKPPSTRASQQYRDSVLWRGVLRTATDNQVLFVTNDGGFYRGKDDSQPDPAIASEIDELGLPIKLFRKVEDLLDYFGDKPSLRVDEVGEIKQNFAEAVANAIKTTLDENGGYIVRQCIDADIDLYLTEDSHRLAISGSLEYELADPEFIDSADPAAAAEVSAIAAVDVDGWDISEVQLDSLRVDAIMPHDNVKIADIRYVRSSDGSGVRWRRYTLRKAVPKQASDAGVSNAGGIGPATSALSAVRRRSLPSRPVSRVAT